MQGSIGIKRTVKEDLFAGGIFLLAYLLVYGSICMRSGLLWDEMLDAEGGATGMYIAAGRWGLALYRWVFGEGIFPVVAGVVAGGYISSSLVLQTHLLGLRTWPQRMFYGAVYLASIQWAFQLEFSHQSDAVAFGLLCSTAAVWCLQKHRWLLGTMAMVLAFGVYQTVALHTLSLLLALVLAADSRMRLGGWLKSVACMALGMLLGTGVAHCAYGLSCVSAGDIAFQRDYQWSMSRWSEFPADASWGEQADFLWYYGSRFFKMTCKNMLGCAYAGQWVYATALVPLCLLVAGRLRQGGGVAAWLFVAGCLVLWALPFCPILLLFTDQGARVNLAEPVALASLWALYLGYARGKTLRRWAAPLGVLACVALIKSAYRVGDIAYNEASLFQQEVECVRALHMRGMCAAEAAGLESPSIILLGGIPAHREVTWPRRECFEGHSAMTPPEMLPFYTKYLQIDNLRKGTEQEMQIHGAAYRTMSTWPAAGSVRVDGGDVIIRVD